MTGAAELRTLAQEIIECRACPRLVAYREKVAREKRRMFRDWTYWGKPVPGFGDFHAQLLILGLAPAAHGANRTGRVFTGDRSGEFLYRLLHKAGFASQPASLHRDDGLQLNNAYITATIRCAPPENKPLPRDRKSTRLNSSHLVISYAVFCLKKKKKHKEHNLTTITYQSKAEP